MNNAILALAVAMCLVNYAVGALVISRWVANLLLGDPEEQDPEDISQ